MPITDYDLSAGAVPDDPGVTTGDFARTVGAGAADLGSNVAGLARYGAEATGANNIDDIAQGFQKIFGAGAEGIRSGLNPEAKQLLESTLTSPEFWDHPVLASALKTAGMTPAMAALAIPGGLAADAVMASVLAGAAGGAVNAGAGVDEFYKKLDAMPDADLRAQSPKYAAMREVLDERAARAKFAREAMGWAPALNAIVGAGAAVIGPAGGAARRIAGGASDTVIGAGGRISGTLGGAAEAGIGGAAQAGTSDILSQQSDIEANFRKDLDAAHAANSALEGGALGGLQGGLVGAVLHGRAPAPEEAKAATARSDAADATSPVETSDVAGQQPQVGRASQAPAAPVPSVQLGNPQSAPARSGTVYPKKGRGETTTSEPDVGAQAKSIETTSPTAPDADQTAGLATANPVPAGLDVNAAVERLQNSTQPAGTPEGNAPAPQSTPQTAPLEVAQASRNLDRNTATTEAPQPPVEARPAPEPQMTQLVTPEPPPAPAAPQPAGGPIRTGRVLRREGDIDQPQQINVAKNLGKEKKLDDEGNAVRGGKRYSSAEKAALDERLNKAQAIADKHLVPETGEEDYLRKIPHRDAVVARAKAMVEEARAQGIKISERLKKSEKGNSASDHPAMQILTEANALVHAADKTKQGKKLTDAVGRFKQREAMIRAGYSDDVLAERRAEGDEKLGRKNTGDTAAAAPATPEEATAEDKVVEATPEAVAREAQDEITTGTPKSKRSMQLDDGTEEVNGQTRAKAANAGRVLSEDEKAAIAAKLGLSTKGKPERVPTKTKTAEEVNLNPTEAQKLAGNYKKGHRRVAGLDFTIENPKGATRRGTGEDGKPWAVKMPGDYGYIRRTKGADGDHIDATDLRHGSKHFVIDQLDHRTGEFDEHKLFLRAKDEADARDAYERSFSDGKAKDRMGHIHEVTEPELHDWLDEGDHTEPHLSHVAGEEDRTFTPPAERGVSDTLTGYNGEKVKAERSDYLSNEIDRFDFSRLEGVGPTLAKFFQNRFKELADSSSTVVHYVTPEDMQRLWGNEFKKDTPLGYHTIDTNGVSHVIVSTGVKDRGVERGSLAHVVLHEVAHSVTVREINESAASRRTIERLAALTKEFVDQNRGHIEQVYGNDPSEYAMTNAKEFVAEAFSNKDFQELLTQVPIKDPALRDYLGLTSKTKMSMWDVFRGFVKKAVQKLTGQMPNFDSVLDGIMKVGETLERQHRDLFIEQGLRYGERSYDTAPEFMRGEALKLSKGADDVVQRFLESRDANSGEHAARFLKLRTFNNMAELADHFFGDKNPVRTVYNAIEKMRVTADKLFAKSEPMIRRLVELRAKDAEGFREFSSLLHDATVANVHPDVPLTDAKNAHLGKNRVVGEAQWSKAQHPELARRYAGLSPELKEAWHEVTKHFRDTQNKMSLGIIENRILKMMGIEDAALARRIHEGTATDADRARVGADMLDTLEQAGELSKIEGPYVPLMRRGDHVVKGDYRVATPAGAKKLSGNEFEFSKESDATDYAKRSPLKVTVKKVWVDENTGEPTRSDGTKVSAKDLDAKAVWRAEVQNRHVEFVQGKGAAERRAADLAKAGDIDVHKVVPREFEVGGRQGAELSAALQRLVSKVEKSEAYKQSSPTQQAALRQAIQEAAAASHGSTRIASKALPRRGVQGYSEDLVQNMGDYGESSSRYLAKLEHGPDLEAGMKDMEEQLKGRHSEANQYGRTMIANEVKRRVNSSNGFEQGGKFAPFVKRAMAISFIDKLASPAYSVINAMQPGMVTMPYLSGRHGVGRAAAALGRAYSDISAGRIIKQGLKETAKRARNVQGADDFVSSAIRGLNDSRERDMMQYMVDHGVVDPAAGMEVRALTKSYSGIGGKVDAALGYLEGVTREMPRAIEAVNRMSTALAAYRLERGRGATHDKAVQYAQDAVNNTQFNYSPTNAPPMFNHPLAKMAFQFKKFGQGMYQLIGGQIGKAYRNASEGDRKEAVKTLIGLAATHMAMAGALGLPTEPFKYLVMASGLVGGPQWGDVEDQIRKAAADVFGKTGGEVFTRGLPRLLNLDLSRVGLDSVTSFGEPRTAKESDVKAWLFESITGPVAALGVDYAKAISAARDGDFEKAAELMVPMKVASDTLRAYRQATEGKKNARGQQTSAPYSFQEAALRVAGFGAGREAEEGAAKSSYYRQSQELKDAREGLMNSWLSAPSTGKSKAMADITRWNQGQPVDDRITLKELTSRMKRGKHGGELGIAPNKRTKHLLVGSPYNT